jgi:hypothetical protein
MRRAMRSSSRSLESPGIVIALARAALAGAALAACVDLPAGPPGGDDGAPAVARLIVAWDPLDCGAPHRVAVELADDDGVGVSASTPCSLGGLSVDVAHLGRYRGRIYAWASAAPLRSEAPIDVAIDQPIVRWTAATPR